MKNLLFIFIILIVLFKTGNVLSNNNIFNVNNIKINGEISKNKEKLINEAFKKGFEELINRLLVEEDYKKFSTINLKQIKEFISYYQISESSEELDNDSIVEFNISFDKKRMHKFFGKNNVLYSDVINAEMILIPLLVREKQYFIYTKNFFYENWNTESSNDLIQYTLPVENIENIQIIQKNKDDIYNLSFSDFFKEYSSKNMAFVIIEINKNKAKIFLSTKIGGKKIKKTLLINQENLNQKEFKNKIIFEVKKTIKDLIKLQNLIDVRTPSFLNVEIKLDNSNNLEEFNSRIKNIDLIDDFYVQKLNKDFALVKIKFLGKIDKIINKLKDNNIELKMYEGQWQLEIT